VDALVSRFVLSGISDAQRRESEFLTELISITDRVLCLPSVFCQSDIATLTQHVCNFACLVTLDSFLFVSFL